MSNDEKINSKLVYLDNNSTTITPKCVIEEYVKWVNSGNLQSDYPSAVRCQKMLDAFKSYIGKLSEFVPVNEKNTTLDDENLYDIIFTSGASESNGLFIRSVVDSFNKNMGAPPHILSTEIEHKSILDLLKQLEGEKRITLTLIKPNMLGFISVLDVKKELKPETVMATIMSANNETGVINDIAAIAKLCHENNTIIHTDATQSYGKYNIKPVKLSLDGFSASFHKLHGMIGCGLLVIKHKLVRGFKLQSQIAGTGQMSLRGGTMSSALIASSFEALKYSMTDRLQKNEHLNNLKRYTIKELAKRASCRMYAEYLENIKINKVQPNIEIVFISSPEDIYLCGTLMLSVVKRNKPEFCNVDLKKYLYNQGVIISIGSSCNTYSKNASHVIKAMECDSLVRKGIFRVSFGDETTKELVDIFIRKFISYLASINR